MHSPSRTSEESDSDSDSDVTIDINDLDDPGGSFSRWEIGCPLQRMVRLDYISLSSISGEPSQGSFSQGTTLQVEEDQDRGEDREHQLKHLYRACMDAELETNENQLDDDSDSDTSSIGWDDVDFESVIDMLLEVHPTMPTKYEDNYVSIYPSLHLNSLNPRGHSHCSPALSAPLTLHPITLHSSNPGSTVDCDNEDSNTNLLLLYLTLSTPELRADPWNPVPRILRAVDRPSTAESNKSTVYLFHPPLAPLSSEDSNFMTGKSSAKQERTSTVAHWIDFLRQILEGLSFLHEHGVVWGGFPSSNPPVKSHATDDLAMFMMDISADPFVLTRPPGINGSGAPHSFDRSRYPVKYYFTNFRNAQQLSALSASSSAPLRTKSSSQSQPFVEDVRACGAWIESLLPHLPPLVQPLLPLTRAMASGTFGADDARKLFEARVRSLAKHVWEQAVKEVGWRLSGVPAPTGNPSPKAAMRRAKTVSAAIPREEKKYAVTPRSSTHMPPGGRSVRAPGFIVRSKSSPDPVPTEKHRNDVFGDLDGISSVPLPVASPSHLSSRVTSSKRAERPPHNRSHSAQVGVVRA